MNIFGIGIPEIAVIVVLALLIFGPKRLPQLGKTIGKTLKGLQTASKEFENEINKSLKLNENEFIKEKVIKIQKEENLSKIILNNNECLLSKALIFTEVLDRDLQNIYNVKYNFFEYGQTAISATLRHSKGHKGHAFQFFQKNGDL